ncbi:MAG: hypothetical protein AAGE52_10110 [Myxococcota bacterium]
MSLPYLLDQAVRQSGVLIARLATVGGKRVKLAEVENQLFFAVTEELERLGIGRKVGADMFGMALRSYLRKINRIKQSHASAGRSLWELVFAHISEHAPVSRAKILLRFSHEDDVLLRGVLHDLVESGMLRRAGEGAQVTYAPSDPESLSQSQLEAAQDALVWAAIYRHGPVEREALLRLASLRAKQLEGSLERLLGDARIERSGEEFSARSFLVERDAAVGWEAAVFDHLHAVIATVVQKLTPEVPQALRDATGGSTYTIDLAADHPLRDEALALLERFREEAAALRARVEAHNEENGQGSQPERLVLYAGQRVERS